MTSILPADPLRNRLLARLETAEYRRIAPHLQIVPLLFNQPIYELDGVIEYAYFPTQGVISAVVTMKNGDSIETATIGNEGVTGIPALIEPERSPSRLYVQIAGGGANADGPLSPRSATRRPDSENVATVRNRLHGAVAAILGLQWIALDSPALLPLALDHA